MSETLQSTPERPVEVPKAPSAERPRGSGETTDKAAERLEQAQAAVAAETSVSEQPVAPTLPAQPAGPLFIDKAIKNLRLRQSMAHVQAKLSPGDKALSKLVHQPLVRAVSDSTAKTVSRPSGLLGGGIFAFIGSLAYLLLARFGNFQYNYLLFVGFFISGFILGLVIELAMRTVHR